jgi:hypothetical protein
LYLFRKCARDFLFIYGEWKKWLSLHQEIKHRDMTTITIQDTSPQAKKFIAYARSLPFAKVKRANGKSESEFNLYESLDRAFADVRLMLDGKKRKKPAEELLYELQNGL